MSQAFKSCCTRCRPYTVVHTADVQDNFRPKRYMPFAEGPRDCLGQNLAKVSLVATMATLLSRLSFSLGSKVPALLMCILLQSCNLTAIVWAVWELKKCKQTCFLLLIILTELVS